MFLLSSDARHHPTLPSTRHLLSSGTMIDYHLHGNFSGHGTGDLAEYVEAAVAKGFTEIGFSDHLPEGGRSRPVPRDAREGPAALRRARPRAPGRRTGTGSRSSSASRPIISRGTRRRQSVSSTRSRSTTSSARSISSATGISRARPGIARYEREDPGRGVPEVLRAS